MVIVILSEFETINFETKYLNPHFERRFFKSPFVSFSVSDGIERRSVPYKYPEQFHQPVFNDHSNIQYKVINYS